MRPPKSKCREIFLVGLYWLLFFCQVYDENDYRRARFVGRQKEVSWLLKCREDVYTYKIHHNLYLYTSNKIFCPNLFPFLFPSYESIWGHSSNLYAESELSSVTGHTGCFKVNKNFAISLVAEEPVTDVESRVVSCDGGGGALGHPKVYINLVKPAIWIHNLKWCVSFCLNLCVLLPLPEEGTW